MGIWVIKYIKCIWVNKSCKFNARNRWGLVIEKNMLLRHTYVYINGQS